MADFRRVFPAPATLFPTWRAVRGKKALIFLGYLELSFHFQRRLFIFSTLLSLFSSADQFPASYMTAGGGGHCFSHFGTSQVIPIPIFFNCLRVWESDQVRVYDLD